MRKLLPHILIASTFVLLTGRLLQLQVFNDSLKLLSDSNAISVVYNYPERGYIYDRNGKLLVANQLSYDVMVTPIKIRSLDTVAFCDMLNIRRDYLERQLERATTYSPRLPSVVVQQISRDEYAYIQEQMHRFPGFYIQKRTLREYQVDHSANVLGYMGEADEENLEKDPYYRMGDHIGIQGIEAQYEKELRGVKGVQYIQKDRFNRDIGPYKESRYDTLPQRGEDITLTIDAALQEYGKKLMENKRGGIVAIEPNTGEILSLVTAPDYDPALMVGRERSKNFNKLFNDTIARPLYDRSLLAQYPPGSPFKILNALIALEEGVVDTQERFWCNRGFSYGRTGFMRCHSHPSPVSMNLGIYESCNAYFGSIYQRIIDKYPSPQEGIDNWGRHLRSFGLGDFLGYDLPIGRPGLVPDSDFYNRYYQYPEHRWHSTATMSNAIGQGEVIATPIQLANIAVAVANRGHFYTPHVLKKVGDETVEDPQFSEPKHTTVRPEHFEPIIQGMHQVYERGTAWQLRIPGIEICGKTGTAENFARIDGKRVQLTDHSIFMAFAPKDDPQIAIAVFVENGYWGNRYAGRIASLMIEKYLKGTITRTDMENWILSHSLEEEYAKLYSGESFRINQ